MKTFLFASLCFLMISCNKDNFPTNEINNNSQKNDNYTYIKETTDKDHVTTTTTDNHSVSVTTTTITTNEQTSETVTEPVTEEYVLALFEGNTSNLTSGNFTLGNMPTLTFYLEGEHDKFAINQTGVTPIATDFNNTVNNFFTYTIDKNMVTLHGAEVNPDNVSDITLVYKTFLYGFVEKDLTILNLDPVEFTINVK
jgi:hypothetical protein